VEPGELLVQLKDDTRDEIVLQAECELDLARLQRDADHVDDLAKSRSEQRRVESLEIELARRMQQLHALTVTAPTAGRVIRMLEPREMGRFVDAGVELATIASGPWQVRAQLSGEQMAACNPAPGDPVAFRPNGATGRTIRGHVERVVPLGSRQVDMAALTQHGGGDIVVGEGGQAAQPYFEVRVSLDESADSLLRHGLTGQVRFVADQQPVGLYAYRRVMRFINSISQS
jgi:multidrug resistance efflux pump